jgi:hypothetical protein
MPPPPSLQELSFSALVSNVANVTGEEVAALPDFIQLSLFDAVLAAGKLTEGILEAFAEAARGNEALASRIASLDLRPLPPRPTATRSRWLGENPSWY